MKSTTTPYLRSFKHARELADNESVKPRGSSKKSSLAGWDKKRDWLRLLTEPKEKSGDYSTGLSNPAFDILYKEARKKNTSLPPKLVNAILEAAKIRKKNKKSSGGKVYKNNTRRANYK